jgi:hypothetical protein
MNLTSSTWWIWVIYQISHVDSCFILCFKCFIQKNILPLADHFKPIKPMIPTKRGCNCTAAFYTVSYRDKYDLDPALSFKANIMSVLHHPLSFKKNQYVRTKITLNSLAVTPVLSSVFSCNAWVRLCWISSAHSFSAAFCFLAVTNFLFIF